MVRAKFRCTTKTSRTSVGAYGKPEPVDQEEVTLQAVMGPENEEWSKWTPSGSLTMTISNKAAVEKFTVGKEYFLDITAAEG